MSLPPGFLDELRGRLSLGQVVGRKVMWDSRKSNQGKGDLWAPCPFHQEKTASFHVDDRKGFYYCFGCHAKGDAFSFVQETENVGFMEAIRILAGEAGMQMPERDPQAQQKADEHGRLIAVMEQAVRYFRLNLQTAAAGAARDYLIKRGLDEDAQARWDIGFAPAGWEGLRSALTSKGIAVEDLLKVGLVKASDKGRQPYDTFRDRIMFPIRDGRGRAIAFGGRAMDPGDNAKYLNSPETPLFDKSRTLYNLQKAREAAGKGLPLVVAEGYMDVIALSEAGFGATVAPLGTAVTPDHLAMLWRVADEPIIALDGDVAGQRAAMRVIDMALPLLQAGKSLRFALMPDGMDPDDVLKAKGRGAMDTLLADAQPMVDLLWQREISGRTFDSPERRAALEKALRDKTQLITDPSIRAYYDQALKDLRWNLFRARKPGRPDQGRWAPKAAPTPMSRASALGTGTAETEHMREAVIFATLLRTPQVLAQFEGALEQLETTRDAHRALQVAILRHADADDLLAAVAADLGQDAIDALMTQPHVAVVPSVLKAGDADLAALCLTEEFAKLSARRGYSEEIRDAEEEITGVADEHLTWRLARVAEANDSTARRGQDESSDEFVKADNGGMVSKAERNRFSDLISQIKIEKSR